MNTLLLRWFFLRGLSFIIHFGATVIYIFAYVTLGYLPEDADTFRNYAGRWKFLTHWNHILQVTTFSLCVICDVINIIRVAMKFFHKVNGNKRIASTPIEMAGELPASSKLEPITMSSSSSASSLNKSKSSDSTTTGAKESDRTMFITIDTIRDTVVNSLAFPCGIFVTILFWTLYTINPELVLPPANRRPPSWINHVVHSLVGPLIVLETILTYHKRPAKITGVILVILWVMSYMTWTFYLGLAKDLWVYPIVGRLAWPARIGFIVGCSLFCLLLYSFGGFIHYLFWSPKRRNYYLYGPRQASCQDTRET